MCFTLALLLKSVTCWLMMSLSCNQSLSVTYASITYPFSCELICPNFTRWPLLFSSSPLSTPHHISGPVFGGRSTEWLTNGWVDNVPSLGWEDTIAYLSIPVMLVIAQSVSLRILTPPSDDPAMQSSQRILKYLPLMIGYFSLSVPAGLGVYWVINNILSTVTTGGIKEYFKRNPVAAFKIDLDLLANSQQSVYNNPVWGYT